MLYCCGTFRASSAWSLSNEDRDGNFYIKRRVEVGNCPKCNKFVVRIWETNLQTNIEKNFLYKDRKAFKAYQSCKNQRANREYNPKYGSTSNMNWVYFDNKEIKNHTGNIIWIRHYQTDFNGGRILVAEIPVDYEQKIFYTYT